MARAPATVGVMVQIPSPWRGLAGGKRLVAARGRTVGEALGNLVARYPGLRPRLRDETGELRSFVLVFVNGQDIRSQQGEDTPLGAGDQLALLPALEGG